MKQSTDTELLNYLANMWDSTGRGHYMMGLKFDNSTGDLRGAIKTKMDKDKKGFTRA